MLDKRIRVLNFDNSIIAQSNLFSRYPAEIIDFTALASCVRLYMSKAVRKQILDSLVLKELNYPTFLGSGDFHHLSEILISQITEPVSLIVFDFHPDWDILPSHFGCGSWVATALKNKNIAQCILIGTGSDDLSFPALQTANLGALANNRLEIYPYRHKPSRVYLRNLPQNRSINARRGYLVNEITWQELEKENLTDFTSKLIKNLPTRKVYISIDKDCLKKEFSLTNWEQGLLSLDQLLMMLRLMRRDLDIIGLDVTGDYSSPEVSNKIKAFVSRIDHPKEFSAHNCSVDLIRSVNEQANLAILQEVLS
ncbi:MAG: hypothetical protein COV71_03750 [Candidatus Omnitrophica bacterium CG11_big_fil_rev_8_21_14_0_20_41_12]|nr:MAG: hypothetical protein COV71_03750 [Candidatus Omnitrophica bacterium CG11_big_fil_rev_8_21_14_0_20_41_12]